MSGHGSGKSIEGLDKTRQWGHSPFWCLCQKLSLSVFTLIRLCYTKALEWSNLVPGPKAISSSSEIMNLTSFTSMYHKKRFPTTINVVLSSLPWYLTSVHTFDTFPSVWGFCFVLFAIFIPLITVLGSFSCPNMEMMFRSEIENRAYQNKKM